MDTPFRPGWATEPRKSIPKSKIKKEIESVPTDLFTQEAELYKEEAEKLKKYYSEIFGRQRADILRALLSRGILSSSVGQRAMASLYSGEFAKILQIEDILKQLLSGVEKKRELQKRAKSAQETATGLNIASTGLTAIGALLGGILGGFGAIPTGIALGQVAGQIPLYFAGKEASKAQAYYQQMGQMQAVIENLRNLLAPQPIGEPTLTIYSPTEYV